MAGSLNLDDASSADLGLARAAAHLLAAKYFMLASFVMLVYEHMITFSDEVDRIWQREWTGATWLFALNRYLTELQFIVNLVSFHHPGWTGKACERFIPFAGASTIVSVGIAEIVLIIRTYALYQRNKSLLVFLSLLWCGQMAVMGSTLRKPTRVMLPEGLVGCIEGAHGDYAAAFWLAPLAMDTIIFILTVTRTLKYIRQNKDQVRLVHVMLRDGVLYFTAIFIANLGNCLIYYIAPYDLKVIGASFSQIITILMISRLQLNLRSSSICAPQTPTSQLSPDSPLPIDSKLHEKRFFSNGTFGTISALSLYFDATVTELGRDVVTPEVTDHIEDEAPRTTRRCSCNAVRCICLALGARPIEAEVELEMGPIRPVSGGAPTPLDASSFSPLESEWLDTVIQVSPARLDDGWTEEELR